jgi:hypothetical protein
MVEYKRLPLKLRRMKNAPALRKIGPAGQKLKLMPAAIRGVTRPYWKIT